MIVKFIEWTQNKFLWINPRTLILMNYFNNGSEEVKKYFLCRELQSFIRVQFFFLAASIIFNTSCLTEYHKARPFSSHNTLAYFQTTCSETSDAMDRTVYIYLLNGYGIFLSIIFLVFRPKYNRSESAVATNQVLPESFKTVSTNQFWHLFWQTSDVITCKKILTRKNWDSINYINIYFLYSN